MEIVIVLYINLTYYIDSDCYRGCKFSKRAFHQHFNIFNFINPSQLGSVGKEFTMNMLGSPK